MEKTVKNKIKVCVVFLAVHLFLITAVVVFMTYNFYPYERGHLFFRRLLLKQIFDEVKLYQKQTGNFPENLDTLLRYDKEKQRVFFGPKELKAMLSVYWEDADKYRITEFIRYELKDGVPVITDLGTDRKEGGIGPDMDISYCGDYKIFFSFWDFLTTREFLHSLTIGSILAAGFSLCLFGIWKKKLLSNNTSLLGPIVSSVLLFLFESWMALFILGAHVYPHH